MKEGWEIKKLREVCELSAGGDVPKDNFSETKTEKYQIPIYANGEKNNGFYGYTSVAKVTKPSITVSARGTIGFSVKRLEEFFPVVRLIVVTPINLNELNLNYLDYAIKMIDFKHSGSSIPQLTVPMIRDYEIPLPDLPEQKRIVSILDEAFAAIAKAKANAEQNLKNAKELFESYLQGVFEKKGDGWEEKRFDEVCVLQRGFDLPTHSRFEGEHPLVSSNGITDRINQWKVKAPGVVTGRSGTIGNVHFIDENFWPLNTALYIKEFHGNYERCIYYFLLQFDLGKYSSGAGVPTLNRNNVHSVKVWFPKSLTEQQTIVRQLDALRTETQKLEAIYQKKLNDLEELKKSILQKAFAGELPDRQAGLKTEKSRRDDKIIETMTTD